MKKYFAFGLVGVALVVLAMSLSWGVNPQGSGGGDYIALSSGGDGIAFYGTATHGYTVMATCEDWPGYHPSTTATGNNWYILRIDVNKKGWYDLCDGCQSQSGGYWDGVNGHRRDFCVGPGCPCF